MQKQKNFKTAFTLVELSIVILIVSILITGLLSVSANSIHNSNVRVTNERMKELYKALGNFLVANKRLPCPASLRKAKSVDETYGIEVRQTASSNICTDSGPAGVGVYNASGTELYYGMIPVKTLGLPNEMAEDGFGNKFTYVIHQGFAGTFNQIVDFNEKSFSTIDPNNIMTIKEKHGATTQTITPNAIMVIISHGSNKAGAYNANSSEPNPASTDADEQDNYATNYDNNSSPNLAVYNNSFTSTSTSSEIFDDIVFFKTRNDFIEDFDAMFLMPCRDATGSGFPGTQSAYYRGVVYGSACTNPTDGTKSKKCEAYGTWIDLNPCP